MAKGVATPARVFLGEALKELREDSGRTLNELAACIDKDRTRIINLLNGEATLEDGELTSLAKFLGAKGHRLRALQALNREARKPPTDDPYTSLGPDSWRRIAYLEAKAQAIMAYESGIFPAQIQSPEYTGALLKAVEGVWLDQLDEHALRSRVDFRIWRQRQVFHGPEPKRVRLLFTEEALDARFGSPEVMRAQFAYVLDAIQERSDLIVRIIPRSAWNNLAQGSGLVLFEFGSIRRPVGFLPVAYGPSAYLDKADDTARMQRAFQRLESMALSPEESKDLIRERLEEPQA